ncbi:MAG: 6-hydroxycyclohex-1-ene-1-carbonyl-CoA dehydrogenase [Acidobacteria bacterium]|nr:6-hydroxycyclohex-1-ene-1-carbonyl-CoA dehydrogenase [Acidobacteriota bacterium]
MTTGAYTRRRALDEEQAMWKRTARGVFLVEPNRVEIRDFELPDPASDEAIVRVAGCGLCHTDISFYTGAVKTRHPLPLILGHEISGTVAHASPPFDVLIGHRVIVPAVLPCGRCDLCEAGRDNACTAQAMPGNHIHGGFATHVVVPARHLMPLEFLDGHRLPDLAVIADAVTTPYQALKRARVQSGDLVIVIGVGGIGTFGVQIARALGAQVAAIDVADERLAQADALGAQWTFNPRAIDAKTIKAKLLADTQVSTARWRILEMSGTVAGQELAWALLVPASTLGVIGFTMDRPEIRLSNLMAFDAVAFGSWGCSPRLYPEVIQMALSRRIQISPFVEPHSLDDAPDLFTRLANGEHRAKRPVLLPY